MELCELENEIPSEHELRTYVLCQLKEFFVGLVPELPVPANLERWFAESEMFAIGELGGSSCARLVVDTLLRAHERLNELPRSDSLWENTTGGRPC